MKPLVPARAAAAAIADIADALRKPPPAADRDPTAAVALYSREPGWALFYAYLDQATPKKPWRQLAERYLARAVATVARADKPFFSHGFAGTAWAVEHLLEQPELNEDVDPSLASIVDLPRVTISVQYGLAGFGIYAVERGATELLERIVERLAREQRPDGAWATSREFIVMPGADDLPEFVVRDGVYSGVAGVAGFLGACGRDQARPLLDRALAYLLGRRGLGLGWAEGSLGITTVAFIAARKAGLPHHEKAALAHALRLAKVDTPMRDAAFAQGAAGAAHMFHRLYRATGDERFADASRRWFTRLLARRKPGRGLAGFAAYSPTWQRRVVDVPVGWIGLPGLLGGVAGIGLALLSALHDQEPAWDRCLLLS